MPKLCETGGKDEIPRGPGFPKERTVKVLILSSVHPNSFGTASKCPVPPLPVPGSWLLALDVVLQSQRHLLLQLIDLLPAGYSRPVYKIGSEEG